MNKIDLLFLIGSIFFPLIGLLIAINIKLNKLLKLLKPTIAFFLVHNALFLFGISLKGDYIDYSIFAFEYLFYCILIFALFRNKSFYIKIVSALGMITIAIISVVGFFSMLTSDTYEADKIFHFKSNNEYYETREYSFGHTTLKNTRYTFETYRQYSFLPIEIKIDKSILFDDESNLNLNYGELKITIQMLNNKEEIVFKDYSGHVFSKQL